ncbi:MAG: exodeoxyribonuclease V subunit gamma, partial [Marmoricola sp.]
RDILVMCPDIEAYAPLVEAAFGMGGLVIANRTTGVDADWHPGQRLQVRLADRSLTQTNPLLAVIGKLLDLAGGRAGASEVLDLLESQPVRRRFGFKESDLETITSWVEKAGIRWAYDERHRDDYGLADYVQNTWRFGLDRLLAGVAMSDDAQQSGPGWIGTTLPLDDVGSTSIDLAGRLAELLDRLEAVTDRLVGSHGVDHWLDALRDGVDSLTAVPRGEEWQVGQVQRELVGLSAAAARQSGRRLELRLPDVRALMAERLSGRPTRANFRTGTLTVCTMVPMRSVPHRVVCLLGLDDGVFPRAAAADGDDVLARTPLTGERDPRSEDRQLLLDAVLAATEHLVVTYSGANETTGQPRPPAVPLGELLDALDDTAAGAGEHVLRKHPLQPFAAANLAAGELRREGPFSFDRAALRSAEAAAAPRREPERMADVVLSEHAPGDVELAELIGFLKAPVRTFLRRRLDVALPEKDEEVLDGLPVELDALQQWKVGDRMLTDLRRGRTPDQALGAEWRRGVLPPGRLGWRLAKEILDQAQPVADLADGLAQRADARTVDIDVDLGGRRLRGTVGDVFGDRVVKVSYSRLGPQHWIEAWVSLLGLCAWSRRGWSAGAVGRGRKNAPPARVAWSRVDEAGAILRDLVALYDAGMREPLPLPLKTGHAWATERSNKPYWRGRRTAGSWESTFDWSKEDAEPAHVATYGKDFTFASLIAGPVRPGEEYDGETTRFGALAMRLWMPMISRAKQG